MFAQKVEAAKLVMSVFTGEQALFKDVLEDLERLFGPIDFLSELLDFDWTDYYQREFGRGLKRRILSFEELKDPAGLSGIKLRTMELEQSYLAPGGSRRVNIDPGYLTLERFVLASRKNFGHRIYIGDGVYADLTLLYRDGAFRPLEWTYPDYRDKRMSSIIEQIRRRYAFSIGRGLRRGSFSG